MYNKTYTYLFLLLLGLPSLLTISCSQEDMPEGAGEGAYDSGIVFRVYLPEARSRSTVTTVAATLNDGFHISAFCPEVDASAGNALNPYFSEQYAQQLEDMPGYFGIFDQSSEQFVWPSNRHGKQGILKFFAFYPSRDVLRQSAGAGEDYFVLSNNSKKQATTVTYDYRLNKFKVHKDISRHIDFVTATAEGSKSDNATTGVRLDFEHQLSRVALTAWGNTLNDIEIAGVRIGRAITEGNFNFTAKPAHFAQGDNTANGDWVYPSPQVKDCVEYIFREGDVVVKVGSGSHTSKDGAASIMGNGGWAMLIPFDNTGWNLASNANQKQKQGLYFSVLLRIKVHNAENTLVYPYVNGGQMSDVSGDLTDAMTVVYLSVKKETGEVTKRVYMNTNNKKFYTDPGFAEEYSVPETEEIRNYGWAAIPLADYRWKPGYQYTYALNYSEGVGVHDPYDPHPGQPIISKVMVDVTQGKEPWPRVNDFTPGDSVNVPDIIIE